MPADHSMAPGMSMGTDTGVACEDAFAGLDLTDLAGISSLDAASDVLDDTIADCGSVAEWQALFTQHGWHVEVRSMGEGTPFANVLFRLSRLH